MGEGNHFFSLLLWPAVRRLLRPRAGQRLLDLACGNGVAARHLAAAGAEVVACDFSPRLLRLARARTRHHAIHYRICDLTQPDHLAKLGQFDGVLCNMALMDVADICPLMRALPGLLADRGRAVISILHPCFNNPAAVLVAENDGRKTTYAAKTARYVSSFVSPGLAIEGQPVPQPCFHRSLSDLLRPAFEAGLMLDAFEEPAFKSGYRNSRSTVTPSWSSAEFSEIPPVCVFRLRRARSD